jgi:hypothetical protein
MKERVVLSTSTQTDPIANLCNDRLSLEEIISAVIDMKRNTEGKGSGKARKKIYRSREGRGPANPHPENARSMLWNGCENADS